MTMKRWLTEVYFDVVSSFALPLMEIDGDTFEKSEWQICHNYLYVHQTVFQIESKSHVASHTSKVFANFIVRWWLNGNH